MVYARDISKQWFSILMFGKQAQLPRTVAAGGTPSDMPQGLLCCEWHYKRGGGFSVMLGFGEHRVYEADI